MAVDLNALVDAREVGRGVEGGPVAGGGKNAGQRSSGRTLPLVPAMRTDG